MLVTIKHLFTALPTTPFELEIPALGFSFYLLCVLTYITGRIFKKSFFLSKKKKEKKKKGKAINTYKRTLQKSGWQWVTHTFISFISYSFSQFISRWQVVTLPKSFVLSKSTLNYSHCFIWYCCCQSTSLRKTDKREVFGSCLWNLPEDTDQCW